MTERQFPGEWLRLLSDESARWVREGLIDQAQKDAILALYPKVPEASRDRTVLIISILGSLLLGAGVILFFASKWPVIPDAVKVASIMMALVGTYWLGYQMQFGWGTYPRIGHALIFLGALFYGAAIWLIAQIFHLDSHYPNAFFFWAAGVLPVAWLTSSRPVLYLASVLLGVWTLSEQMEFEAFNYLYPILVLGVLIPLSRRLHSALAEAGALGGLLLWFVVNVIRQDMAGLNTPAEPLVIGRVLILYGGAVAMAGLARWGETRPYLSVGALSALSGVYIMTFHVTDWSTGAAARIPAPWTGSPFLLAGLGVIMLGLLAAAWRYWQQGHPERYWLVGATGILVASAALTHLFPEIARLITFNLLLFGGTVGLVILGIQRRSELLINLGLALFVIHVITRYVDLFFDAMDKSLFFMLGGVLLLGGGWLLERNRRRWIGELGGGGHA